MKTSILRFLRLIPKEKKLQDEWTSEKEIVKAVEMKVVHYEQHMLDIEDCLDEHDYAYLERLKEEAQEVKEKLFPKEHHVHHGACLSCVSPAELGITICSRCVILDGSLDLSKWKPDA